MAMAGSCQDAACQRMVLVTGGESCQDKLADATLSLVDEAGLPVMEAHGGGRRPLTLSGLGGRVRAAG